MKKKDFEKWAINKYPKEFFISDDFFCNKGEFTWFYHLFWGLPSEITKNVIQEFKDSVTI